MLPTEGRNPRSRRLDQLSTAEVVKLVLDEDRRALAAARRQAPAIARVATLVARALREGGDLVLLGAGSSGRLAVLEAAECPPTFGTDPRRVRAVIAGGKPSVFLAREGSEDREDRGRREGERLKAGDVLIGISASGVTRFVRAALAAARARRAETVLISAAPVEHPRRAADVCLQIDTGSEVLTGSTRLKAGSVTKAVLNAITTGAMVQLGKVYQNLMVDVQPSSAKLVDRRRRIVAAATGLPTEAAAGLLRRAHGEVKTAIVMGRLGLTAQAARGRLAEAEGFLRRALGEDLTLRRRRSRAGFGTSRCSPARSRPRTRPRS